MPNGTPSRLIFATTLAAMALSSPLSAHAVPDVVGVHVRFKGMFAPGGEAMRMQLEMARKLCPTRGMPFRVSGRLEDAGKAEFDDYYSGQPKMKSARIKSHVMTAKSTCEFAVREIETWEIRRLSSIGYTDYELKNDRRRGEYWQSSEHPTLDVSSALPLFMGSFQRETAAAVGLGQKSYAGHTCEMSEVALNKELVGTTCLRATGLPFPKEVDLAGRLAGRDMVLLEKEVTEVRINVPLPAAHFYPPTGAKVVSIESRSRAGNDWAQARCRALEAKTGINPCEEGPIDD